jgi:hypothetical protein
MILIFLATTRKEVGLEIAKGFNDKRIFLTAWRQSMENMLYYSVQ